MRAAVMRDKRLVAADLPRPDPGPGEVLVKTLACGICGSDLHALRHAEQFVESQRRAGALFRMDLARDVVMGHEFCAEIVDYGPQTTRALPVGARVCSRPALVRADGPRTVGYSNDTPGGYAEYMRLTEALLLPVPNGLSTEHAALTEPMAVGLHAVAKARLEPDDAPLVIGCGPVGLAVIAALICLALFNAVFGLSYVTLLPIYADVYFQAGSAGFGLLNAAHGTGALVGTLIVATMATRIRHRGLVILTGAAGMGLGLAIFSRSPGLGLAMPMLTLVGFSNTFYLTQVSTHLQQAVPDHLRGRVMSLYALCWNLLPLGGLLGGVLAAAVDARFAVLVGGAMVAANALVLLASRRLRLL